MSDREPTFTAIRATYRLQFHKGFTFRDATALVPYLARLGISHIYASPLMEARPGSSHGYDIVNHNRLNPEIGTDAEFAALVAALRARGMGLILDIVPNHMAVGGADNFWWLDVLEWGEASPYAAYFDINWDALREDLKGRVLVPVLGDQYGAALERGEIVLRFEPSEGSFSAWYYNHRFSISPFTYATILEQGGPVLARFAADFAALRRLNLAEARHRADEVKRQLAAATADLGIVPAIAAALLAFAGRPGRPASFRRLHRLLEMQAYRLANWRVAAEEINYRRFFNINDLAGLRIELPELFAATHRMVFAMIERGDIEGLRIDHIDGLFDPAGYCAALREAAGESLYITVEKILARYERLPEWPIEGSTGYDFANQALALFVDPDGEAAMTRVYQRLTGRGGDFDAVLYASKKRIMQVNLASEMNVLARRFHRLAISEWRTRDFTFNGMLSALEEVIAAFPVYRTYVGPQGAGPDDRHYIDWAIGLAKARWRPSDTTILDFIQDVLLADLPGHSRPDDVLRTAMQFQQVTGPVMAKAFEDTAFYRYFRLLALNEVGGDPRRFGMSAAAFHHLTADRARLWPRSMLTTATHDTKRGEDARLRIALLSEMPREWGRRVTHWLRLNRRHRGERDGEPVPDRNVEYLFYQMLVGAWPVGLDPGDRAAVAEFTERIEAAMIKSVREGKEQSGWSYPNTDYEAGLTRFVRGVLDAERPSPFLADFADFIGTLARPAAIASLAQLVLKLTVPGVPDIYQGGELWDFSLIDPDNRRPVDFAQRQRLLDEISGFGIDSGPHPYPPPLAGEGVVGAVSYNPPPFAEERGAGPAAYSPPPLAGEDRVGAFDETEHASAGPLAHELATRWQDGREKLFVTARLLGLRRDHPELFAAGDYQPLGIGEGRNSDRLCAFARSYRDRVLVVVVPRLTYGLLRDGGSADFGVAEIALASPGPWRNLFTGATLTGRQPLPANELFRDFPVAVLCAEGRA